MARQSKQLDCQTMRDRARTLRKNATRAERMLWSRLRNHQLDGLKFRRPQVIGPFIADFYCAAAMLVIETDGITHEGRDAYDQRRTAYLESEGYRVLRFFDREVLDSTMAVLEEILRVAVERIGVQEKLSPQPSPCNGDGARCATDEDRATHDYRATNDKRSNNDDCAENGFRASVN